MSDEPRRRKRDLVVVLVVATLVNFVAFIAIGLITVHQSHAQVNRNCRTGQRSYDTLAAVIHASYNPPQVKVEKLPVKTQQLLADLAPLLAAQAVDGGNEKRVLAGMGPRPAC